MLHATGRTQGIRARVPVSCRVPAPVEKGTEHVDTHPNWVQLGRRHTATRGSANAGALPRCHPGTDDAAASEGRWRKRPPPRSGTRAARLVGATHSRMRTPEALG